jgi:hypothetical protein
MKPLAMSVQLVINERKRLSMEIEIVFEDGSISFKRLDVNERTTIHFDDLVPEAKKSA